MIKHIRQNFSAIRLGWIHALVIALLICAARVIYVSLYAHSLPFWDQWDSINSLIGPWQRNSFEISSLFFPHNEHRIAFTRLVTLILFLLNQHTYDNLVEAYVNGFIYAVTLTSIFLLMSREMDRVHRILIGMAVVTIGFLPFDWENTLVGFQNQFYFMIFFSTALIGLVAYSRPTLKNGTWIALTATACLFTMASGVLAIGAALTLLAVKRACRQPSFPPLIVGILVITFIVGILDIPFIPGNQSLKSARPLEFVNSFLTILIWPLSKINAKHVFIGLLIWLPLIIGTLRLARDRQGTPGQLFALGTSFWVVLQMAAIAHSRGHDLQSVPSRYTEILAVGLISNLFIALQIVKCLNKSQTRLIWILISASTNIGIAYAFVIRSPYDLEFMKERFSYNALETMNILNYLISKKYFYLKQPDIQSPYPDASRLQSFLSDKYLAPTLPVRSWAHQVQMEAPQNEISNIKPRLSTYAAISQENIDKLLASMGISRPSIFFSPANNPISTKNNSLVCSLNVIDDNQIHKEFHSATGIGIVFDGWAFDKERFIDEFDIVLAGTKGYSLEIHTYIPRSDVVKVYGTKTARESGFKTIASLNNVEPGSYKLLLSSNSTRRTNCDTGHTVIVDPAN